MITDPEIPEEEDETVVVTRLMRTSLLSFWLSLSIGTLLFLIYQSGITYEWEIMVTGFVYVIIAFFVNTIILINLFIGASLFRTHRKKLLFRCAIILLNCPVATYYFLTIINSKPI